MIDPLPSTLFFTMPSPTVTCLLALPSESRPGPNFPQYYSLIGGYASYFKFCQSVAMPFHNLFWPMKISWGSNCCSLSCTEHEFFFEGLFSLWGGSDESEPFQRIFLNHRNFHHYSKEDPITPSIQPHQGHLLTIFIGFIGQISNGFQPWLSVIFHMLALLGVF